MHLLKSIPMFRNPWGLKYLIATGKSSPGPACFTWYRMGIWATGCAGTDTIAGSMWEDRVPWLCWDFPKGSQQETSTPVCKARA